MRAYGACADCKVAYLPGLARRWIADLSPGEAKTDAKDAAVIADAARTMPHTLRSRRARTAPRTATHFRADEIRQRCCIIDVA